LTNRNPRLEEYLQWLTIEKGRSLATIAAYRRDLNALVSWMATRHLDETSVSEEDLERYFNGLRRVRRSSSTVARAVAAVRGWFAYLYDEGHVPLDPGARLKGGRRGRTLPKPLAEEEVVALLDSVPATSAIDLRDRALLEILYGTGARVSEVAGVELSDLDFDEELILLTGKGSKQRLVPIGSTLKAALLAYLGPGGRSTLAASKRSPKLFLNARAGALTRQGIDLVIHKRALAVGIDRSRISAHVFRHSCTTHMLAHGADIRVVQELLGHASIATTQLYTAVSVTTLQREYHHAHPRAHD
jgi:site-specific recombinase XerD